MLFNSVIFLFAFLPVGLVLYHITPKAARNYVLLALSLISYAWGDPKYVLVLLVSIVINYFVGLYLGKTKSRAVLAVGIILNLCGLVFFKYFGFLVGGFTKMTGIIPVSSDFIQNIGLPLGISFYTFKVISYIIDIYRGDTKAQKNIFNFAMYVSLFQNVVAGPIVRYRDVESQITDRKVTENMMIDGIGRFIIGLSKKMLISSTVAQIADGILDATSYAGLSTGLAWVGILCYTLHIYFDFSGYSDMAIGLGKMFGFNFLENFNYPYISRSIQEFWRRWHISLSSWFKDYVYIPLGGNRKGQTRTLLNLVAIFFLCGLWHGASWNFVVWGLYQGVFLILERLFLKKVLDKLPSVIRRIYTIVVVMVGWVFFRITDIGEAIRYIKIMFVPQSGEYLPVTMMITPYVISVICVGIIGSTPIGKRIPKWITYPAMAGLLVLSMAALVNSSYSPFIYGKF